MMGRAVMPRIHRGKLATPVPPVPWSMEFSGLLRLLRAKPGSLNHLDRQLCFPPPLLQPFNVGTDAIVAMFTTGPHRKRIKVPSIALPKALGWAYSLTGEHSVTACGAADIYCCYHPGSLLPT